MKNDEVIRFAGDVSIDRINIISANGFAQNITNQVVAIEIYEDMFSPFTSGVIAVKETLDFINLFPLIGEEFVEIKVHTPSFTKKNMIFNEQFVIYKLAHRTTTGDRNVVYELHFISREALVDLNKKISKPYEGKVSDIAQNILQDSTFGLETKKDLVLEETPNGIKYISNYWSPVKNLNYLAEHARNANNAPSYLFFENRNGFNFTSLETLSTQPSKQTFVQDAYFREDKIGGETKKKVEEDYKRIVELEVPVLYDLIDRVESGMYASQQISYDIVTKKYKVKNFDMKDDYNDFKHLNTFSPASQYSLRRPHQLMMNSQYYYDNFNGYRDTTNFRAIQRRISMMKMATANQVQITVPGRSDYTVGQKVELDLTKFNPIKKSETDDDIKDAIFSGYYLISSVNHIIDREKHECVMELIKDSYILDPDSAKK